jgi:hypothetical protein
MNQFSTERKTVFTIYPYRKIAQNSHFQNAARAPGERTGSGSLKGTPATTQFATEPHHWVATRTEETVFDLVLGLRTGPQQAPYKKSALLIQ